MRRRAGSSKARWLALELPASGTQARSVDAVAAARALPAGLRARVAGLEGRAVADHPATGEKVLGAWHQQTDAILPLAPEDIWDNRARQHSRPHVGTTEPRTLRRTSVGGDQDLSVFSSPKSAASGKNG